MSSSHPPLPRDDIDNDALAEMFRQVARMQQIVEQMSQTLDRRFGKASSHDSGTVHVSADSIDHPIQEPIVFTSDSLAEMITESDSMDLVSDPANVSQVLTEQTPSLGEMNFLVEAAKPASDVVVIDEDSSRDKNFTIDTLKLPSDFQGILLRPPKAALEMSIINSLGNCKSVIDYEFHYASLVRASILHQDDIHSLSDVGVYADAPPPPPKPPDVNNRAVNTKVFPCCVAMTVCPPSVCVNVYLKSRAMNLELDTFSVHLNFNNILVKGRSHSNCVLELHFQPGLLCNNDTISPLLELLHTHTRESLTLMINDRTHIISIYLSLCVKVQGSRTKLTSITSFASILHSICCDKACGNVVVWETPLVHLLHYSRHSTHYPFILKTVYGTEVMEFTIVELSLHFHFGLANALGLLDRGVHILCKIGLIISSQVNVVVLVAYAKVDPLFEVGFTLMYPNLAISPRHENAQYLLELAHTIEHNYDIVALSVFGNILRLPNLLHEASHAPHGNLTAQYLLVCDTIFNSIMAYQQAVDALHKITMCRFHSLLVWLVTTGVLDEKGFLSYEFILRFGVVMVFPLIYGVFDFLSWICGVRFISGLTLGVVNWQFSGNNHHSCLLPEFNIHRDNVMIIFSQMLIALNDNHLPTCKCLNGSKPRCFHEWTMLEWSDGCSGFCNFPQAIFVCNCLKLQYLSSKRWNYGEPLCNLEDKFGLHGIDGHITQSVWFQCLLARRFHSEGTHYDIKVANYGMMKKNRFHKLGMLWYCCKGRNGKPYVYYVIDPNTTNNAFLLLPVSNGHALTLDLLASPSAQFQQWDPGITKDEQWDPGEHFQMSKVIWSLQSKQWDPGKVFHGENFYNLEDKVDCEGVGNDMIMGLRK